MLKIGRKLLRGTQHSSGLHEKKKKGKIMYRTLLRDDLLVKIDDLFKNGYGRFYPSSRRCFTIMDRSRQALNE